MSADTWKKRALPSLKPSQTASTHYEALAEPSDHVETKTPRVLTRALRSLSSSSLDSINNSAPRRSNSTRRLQKIPSNSSAMMERMHRRVSKDSPLSTSPAPIESPGSPLEQPFSAMNIVHHGYLKTDVSLLKARTEYLVLTDQSLVKLGSIEAAKSVFPQLIPPGASSHRSGPSSLLSAKSAVSEIRFEVPLQSFVAAFNEEGASPRFGIELWWFSQPPKLTYCRSYLFFAMPQERDDWMTLLHKACRAKVRRASGISLVPDNLRVRVDHIVGNTEFRFADEASQNVIFPVAKRVIGTSQRPHAAEEAQQSVDGSSFYLVIGPYICYMIEVLKAEYSTPPGELRVKSSHFGTVTLARFKASVASHEQRFVMSFRSPFGRETRLDLASIHYRRVIETLTRMDRILKPMWPQHFQQIIFDVKGLPPPLQLTSGNDLGGVERSLQAYCAAFHVDMPRWTVEWHTSSQPVFRLLPASGAVYSPAQLMAVFRALRYNSFFKAISFRDVDLSPLASRRDYSPYNEGVVCASLNGYRISDDHYEDLVQSPVLTQEFHALAFGSESIRNIDLTNCLGIQERRASQARISTDFSAYRKTSSEIIRPILMLARAELCMCHSINMSSNPLLPSDVDELANLFVMDHVHFRKLYLSGCSLGDTGLTKLWYSIGGQCRSLETLDTSDNQGVVKADILRHGLNQLRALKKLNVSGNTRLEPDRSLIDEAALDSWSLVELDLSSIALNDATVDVLSGYLQTAKSQDMLVLRLNKCGLTSRQIAKIFRAMGQARKMTVHINANRLDDGIDDLCGALACGYGPWSLFAQMVEFNYESSYTKLWKALMVNKTIECLSLAGSSTPDAASSTACQAVADFFANNSAVRFLDISGYDAKLDEGRLGKEFSRALSGMQANTNIEHLRVRSQMLNVNIGDLAEAISGNRTLHTLDCEDNDFNLSNYRHLIRSLRQNPNIRHFSAFSPKELEKTVRKSVSTAGTTTPARRASIVSRFRHERTNSGSDKMLVQQLHDEWNATVAELELILERNQRLFEESKQPEEDFGPQSPISRHEDEGCFWQSFGGLASKEYESRRRRLSSGPGTPTRWVGGGGSTTSLRDLSTMPGRIDTTVARSNSTASSDVVSPISPTGSLGSPIGTPSDGGSPTGRTFPPIPEGSFNAEHDSNYTCAEACVDHDLQMKTYRRQWSDPVGRIDEEE